MTEGESDAVLLCTRAHSFARVGAVMGMPTQPGDVLILQTEHGVKIHAVGRVTRRGQEHFHAEPTPLYIVDHDEALAVAGTLVAPGRRIFLVKLDSGDWAEVAR